MSAVPDEASPLRWKLLVDGRLPGADNMARDESLARVVSDAVEGDGTQVLPAFLRFYAWERPTLSFGRNEPARSRFDADRLAEAGVDVIRRPTGGRAVLHDREVTYAVIVPARALGGPRETYRRVNAVLAAGLAALGVPAELAADEPTAPLDAGPCFDLPAGGEVVAHGRKLVGSAQARIRGALLQHGSILMHDDQGRIGELATPGSGVPESGVSVSGSRSRPVALAELMAEPPRAEEVVNAVARAARDLADRPEADWRAPHDDAMFALDAAFEAERRRHHLASDWIWRR